MAAEKLQVLIKSLLQYGRQDYWTTYFFDYISQCIIKIGMEMKSCILVFQKKGDLIITENYRGITLSALTAKVYNTLLLTPIQPEVEKILWNFSDSGHSSNHWRSTCKKSWSNYIGHRFFYGIWLHTERKYGANIIICIWSPQRNCYHNYDALQKHESKCLLIQWPH